MYNNDIDWNFIVSRYICLWYNRTIYSRVKKKKLTVNFVRMSPFIVISTRYLISCNIFDNTQGLFYKCLQDK
ncbi:hypothetical protein V1478_012058 [Vespula squamosa]|uniref:Uncharacterized protein n=1 Tax=Vespula squamosa TaxID=30214 RepID=A0ABD2AC56_VESSQ